MRRPALIVLPVAVILLSLIVWVTGVSRSGFWADDFLNVTQYHRSVGDLTDVENNTGKYAINLFWALGTTAFGSASVVPFLLLNSLLLFTGVVLWAAGGTPARWSASAAWWIVGLFAATTAWLPTALWSSNSAHSTGFLFVGAGFLAHERAMAAPTLNATRRWSLAGGLAWTGAVMSNLVYVGLLVLAGYCAVHQLLKLRRLGLGPGRAGATAGVLNLLVPAVYFAAVAYPATKTAPAYATNGLGFIHPNLRFYRSVLAPGGLAALYGVALAGALAGGVLAAARRRDWFVLALLGSAAATALPALVQSQQRDVHYLAMPLLLTISAVVAAAEPALQSHAPKPRRRALFAAAAVALGLLFGQGAALRSYFTQTPYGASLATFRAQVATLTPAGATICARLNLDPPTQSLFIAEMSGDRGFLVAPIDAAATYLVVAGQPCPPGRPAVNIAVSLDGRGRFVASR